VGRKQLPGTDIDIPGTGRKVPLDLFERSGKRGGGLIDEADLEDLGAGDTKAIGSITDDLERLSKSEGSPTAGGAYLGGAAGVVGETTTPGPGKTSKTAPNVGSDSLLGDTTDRGTSGQLGMSGPKVTEPKSTDPAGSSGIDSGPFISYPSGTGPSGSPSGTVPPTGSQTPTTSGPPTSSFGGPPAESTPIVPPLTPDTTPTKPPSDLFDSDKSKKRKKDQSNVIRIDTDLFQNLPDDVEELTEGLNEDLERV
jgi:hypothetical protein